MRILWAHCPLEATIKVAEAGRLIVGWSSARVELLRRRPLQCFRCLAVRHVRTRCPNIIDRSAVCYNCGKDGHMARDCRAVPSCPICADYRPVPPGRPLTREEKTERRSVSVGNDKEGYNISIVCRN